MIVRCDNVRKVFSTSHGKVTAVDGVSLGIEKGEALGLVGGSASGKTTLGKMILGILKPDSGSVEIGTKRPQVIFQDPHSSLDPKMRVADIVGEGLRVGRSRPTVGEAYKEKIEEALRLVRLPESALRKYPHQFSGGERQRIAIARAIVTDPEFIVCDEPVSNLDMTIQLEILKLLKDIRTRLSITYLFISHDLRAVKFICDRVAVMHNGRIVEEGPVAKVYAAPEHSYTKLLISSIIAIP
jgi:peptide/nickel transport system ATP-binding protein/oligopeptide transport system ATP-binding protein